MLAAKSSFAESILGFADDGSIFNKNPELFDAVFTELREERSRTNLEALQKQLMKSNSILQRSKLKGRIQCARRMATMYFPRGKKLKLSGIRVPNLNEEQDGERILSEPTAIQGALRDYWGKVYAAKSMDNDTATKLMNYYVAIRGHKFQFEDLELPDAAFYEEYLPRLRDSLLCIQKCFTAECPCFFSAH